MNEPIKTGKWLNKIIESIKTFGIINLFMFVSLLSTASVILYVVFLK